MVWRDLREWIAEIEKLGEMRVVEGATWQKDIGEITEMLDHTKDAPCVIFDNIPGYADKVGWQTHFSIGQQF